MSFVLFVLDNQHRYFFDLVSESRMNIYYQFLDVIKYFNEGWTITKIEFTHLLQPNNQCDSLIHKRLSIKVV